MALSLEFYAVDCLQRTDIYMRQLRVAAMKTLLEGMTDEVSTGVCVQFELSFIVVENRYSFVS